MPLVVKRQVLLSRQFPRIARQMEGVVVDEVVEQVRGVAPVDTGRGRRELRRDGKFIRAQSYMVALDQGVEPGRAFPPPDRMESWARRKGLNVKGFVLSRSIYRRGIAARRYVERGIRQTFDRRRRVMEIKYGEAIRRAFH